MVRRLYLGKRMARPFLNKASANRFANRHGAKRVSLYTARVGKGRIYLVVKKRRRR